MACNEFKMNLRLLAARTAFDLDTFNPDKEKVSRKYTYIHK